MKSIALGLACFGSSRSCNLCRRTAGCSTALSNSSNVSHSVRRDEKVGRSSRSIFFCSAATLIPAIRRCRRWLSSSAPKLHLAACICNWSTKLPIESEGLRLSALNFARSDASKFTGLKWWRSASLISWRVLFCSALGNTRVETS